SALSAFSWTKESKYSRRGEEGQLHLISILLDMHGPSSPRLLYLLSFVQEKADSALHVRDTLQQDLDTSIPTPETL
ncbi:MAG: hypothetical protein MJE68_02815, partial [Proteobacteria bacterium]|nr:hypothetical protein [Pseudomonadota bacterium]